MLISNTHQFLFVHITKTAGMSMRGALEPFCNFAPRTGLNLQLSRLPIRQSPDRVAFRQHVTARWAKRKLPPQVFERYCKFAVIRNPYDRAVSLFNWQGQFTSQRHYARTQGMSFVEFLEDARRRYRLHDETQARYITDRSGKVLTDRLLRFETLDADFADLARDLKLGDVRLPKANPSKHKPFAEYFDDPVARRLVEDLYAADFELLGYARDPGQRKAVRPVGG